MEMAQKIEQISFSCANFESRARKAEEELQKSNKEKFDLQKRVENLNERESILQSELEEQRSLGKIQEHQVIETVTALLEDILEKNEVDVSILKKSTELSRLGSVLENLQIKMNQLGLSSQVSQD